MRLMLTGSDAALGKLATEKGEKGVQDALNTTLKKVLVDTKTLRDRKRKDYAKQAAALAVKRLELAEVEKRYNGAK